jgi:pyruvate,orthophosphate dikinase
VDLDRRGPAELVAQFKAIIKKATGTQLPRGPHAAAVGRDPAVFDSWNNKRAYEYRLMYGIPGDLGHRRQRLQSMVFGNMGEDSGTGVAFTRNPATGEQGASSAST